MKIKDLVELKSFQPVINLKWADNVQEQDNLLNNYIVTEDLAKLFGDVLETINMVRFEDKRAEKGPLDNVDTLRSHIISGQYGTGKSYFLLMLSIILELENDDVAEQLLAKFSDFPELHYHLKYIINQEKYLVVRINGENENEKRFSDVIQRAVIKRLNQKFDDVVLKSNYQNLLENLMAHKEHEKRAEILEDALADKNYNYQDLVAGLKGHQREAKRRYERLMKEAGLSTGESFKSLDEFIKDVNEYLETKSYDELVIILDEFSAYLDTSIENKRINTDLSNIQDLAQLTAPTSALGVSFITSTHVDMGDVLGRALANQEAIEKVLGRFQQHQIAFEQGNELIRNTIQVDDEKFSELKQDHLKTTTALEDKYNLSLGNYYPLHPATLLYLKPVADNFAQKDRTLFDFLKEVVRENYYNQPVEMNGKLNLVQLDDVFDYFKDPFKQKDKDLFKAYNKLIDIADDQQLQEKFSKSLVVSYASLLSTSVEGAGLTIEDLQSIYLIDSQGQVVDAINSLANNNRSPVVLNDNQYELVVSGQTVNIEQKLQEEAQGINPYQQMRNILDEFNDQIEIKKEYKINYNERIFPLDRELDGEFISVTELKRIDDLEQYFKTNKDGKITCVIPEFNEEYNLDDLKHIYQKKMKDLPKNVALALPKEIYFNEKDLKLYGAIQELKTDQDIVGNEDLKKLLRKRARNIEGKVRNRQLREFGRVNNFVFIFSDEIIKEDFRRDNELFKNLLYRYYHKFPLEIETENINTRRASNPLIDHLIISGETVIPKDSTSNFQKHVFYTMKPLDLVEEDEMPDNYEIKIKVPRQEESPRSYEIWQIISNPQLTIEEKFNKLESAPYGLNEQLTEIYIALAIGLDKFRLRKKDGRVITSPGKDHISEIKDSDYILEKRSDTAVDKKEKVKGAWETLAKLIPNSRCGDFNPRGKWKDTQVFGVLGRELGESISMLENHKSDLDNLRLDSQLIDDLIVKLKEVAKSMKPEELFDNLIEAVNELFELQDYDANLKKLEDVISNFKTFKNSKKKQVRELRNQIRRIITSINPLDNYADLQEKATELDELWTEYQQHPFQFSLISDLEKKIKFLIAGYNQAYKEQHDKYYSKYQTAKKEILDNDMLEIVLVLEEVEFNGIASIKREINRLNSFAPCNQLEIDENKLAACSCQLTDLQIVEEALKEISDLAGTLEQKIYNIYCEYKDRLNDQQSKITDYIEENSQVKLEDWQYVLKAINDDPIRYKEDLITNLNKVVDLINEALATEWSDSDDDDEPKPKYMNLEQFVNEFEDEIEVSGLKEIPFSKLERLFVELCSNFEDEYEGVADKE